MNDNTESKMSLTEPSESKMGLTQSSDSVDVSPHEIQITLVHKKDRLFLRVQSKWFGYVYREVSKAVEHNFHIKPNRIIFIHKGQFFDAKRCSFRHGETYRVVEAKPTVFSVYNMHGDVKNYTLLSNATVLYLWYAIRDDMGKSSHTIRIFLDDSLAKLNDFLYGKKVRYVVELRRFERIEDCELNESL